MIFNVFFFSYCRSISVQFFAIFPEFWINLKWFFGGVFNVFLNSFFDLERFFFSKFTSVFTHYSTFFCNFWSIFFFVFLYIFTQLSMIFNDFFHFVLRFSHIFPLLFVILSKLLIFFRFAVNLLFNFQKLWIIFFHVLWKFSPNSFRWSSYNNEFYSF